MFSFTIGGNTKRSKFTAKAVELDWDKLPDASKEFAIRYGLKQYLADGAAGSETQAEFESGIAARLANLTSGEFKRTAGEGKGPTDSVEVLAKRIATDEVRTALSAQGKKADKDGLAKIVAAHLEKNGDRLRKLATDQIAARKKSAEAVDLSEFGL